jgi:ADP-ribose pyrophosphatase
MRCWKVNNRKIVLEKQPWLVVEEHVIELPDGRVIPDWTWVVCPDYVNVVVRLEDGRFLLFRQDKYALAGASLAIVGGYINPGEQPLAAAKRELLEETGCFSVDWVDLGVYRVDPNRGIATGYLFFAMNAHKVATPIQDDLEEQEIITLDQSALEAALDRGEIQVLAWAAAVAFALRHLAKVAS